MAEKRKDWCIKVHMTGEDATLLTSAAKLRNVTIEQFILDAAAERSRELIHSMTLK